jgi:glycerophosphoryl diester phosphodiesterase
LLSDWCHKVEGCVVAEPSCSGQWLGNVGELCPTSVAKPSHKCGYERRMRVAVLLLLVLLAACRPSAVMNRAQSAAPLIIAHRGLSGDYPEHTLLAYRKAIEAGADFIEPDLVLTRDGVLVARHENEISETTDVAERPEFAARRTTRTIDGQQFTGWFTEDFTLAELRTLRAKERLPQLRPANRAWDGKERVPTFDEVLELLAEVNKGRARPVGVYPETKHPSYFAFIGLPHEAPLLAALARFGYRGKTAPVFIQSFEVGNLMALRGKTDLPLVQLVAGQGGPADRPDLRYADMVTPAGLAAIARYADGIGPEKSMIIPRTAEGVLAAQTGLVRNAQAAGLKVHPWTFRRENAFLPPALRRGSDPAAAGDLAAELRAFVAAGVDGVFTDNTPEVVAALRPPVR